MARRAQHLWGLSLVCTIALSSGGCDATHATRQASGLSQSSSAVAAEASAASSQSSSKSAHSAQSVSTTTFATTSGLRDVKIDMFNHLHGYAWGYRDGWFQVLETQNGGQAWQKTSLPNLPKDTLSTEGPGGTDYVEASFRSQGHIWLAYLEGDTEHVYSTTDNGLIWQESTFSVPGDVTRMSTLKYASQKAGWLLLLGNGATGATAKYLYATSDGGLTWKMINSSARDLPHNGVDAKMVLADNGKDGILASSDFLNKQFVVETTTDGGVHFKKQSMLVPAEIQNPTNITVFPVQMTNHGDARIAVEITTDNADYLVIYTESGGSWKIASSQVERVGAVTWTSNQSTYALVLKNNKEQIQESTDGGLSWYPVGTLQDGPLAPEQVVASFAMTQDGSGFLLVQNSNLSPILYTSSDGGQHWVQK